MFDFNDGVNSHMPFAAYDPENGGYRQFCCIMVNGKWKIHQFKNGRWQRVNTGLAEDATECSPAAEFLFGSWHLTFIGGGAESDRKFRLYHITDLDAGTLPVAVCPADVGFIQKNRLLHASRRGPIEIEDVGKSRKIIFTDAEWLYRVTYDPSHPNTLLISGKTFAGEIFSQSYDVVSGRLFSIEADGVPAYKATCVKGIYYYAQKIGTGFENRKIVKAERVRLRQLPAELVTAEVVPNQRKAMNINTEFE